MDVWQTKEKHIIRKKREFHTVKICIPIQTMDYVEQGMGRLREDHKVPDSAIITLPGGWNRWVKAYWTVERK